MADTLQGSARRNCLGRVDNPLPPRVSLITARPRMPKNYTAQPSMPDAAIDPVGSVSSMKVPALALLGVAPKVNVPRSRPDSEGKRLNGAG